jgi:hypothetical protein
VPGILLIHPSVPVSSVKEHPGRTGRRDSDRHVVVLAEQRDGLVAIRDVDENLRL